MNGEQLFEAIGGADETLLERSETAKRRSGKVIWLKWGALAACAAFAVFCGARYFVGHYLMMGSSAEPEGVAATALGSEDYLDETAAENLNVCTVGALCPEENCTAGAFEMNRGITVSVSDSTAEISDSYEFTDKSCTEPLRFSYPTEHGSEFCSVDFSDSDEASIGFTQDYSLSDPDAEFIYIDIEGAPLEELNCTGAEITLSLPDIWQPADDCELDFTRNADGTFSGFLDAETPWCEIVLERTENQ